MEYAFLTALVVVVPGTNLDMMIANVPAALIGEALAHRLHMKVMRWVTAALFTLPGVLPLLAPP
ncbi:MAG: TMEM165/GDT1 family protein [Nitrosomonas sp.]|nr:TMEM165/GDT1 family protein [Nitrosomonas sp.]MDP1950697.1 TMEM165/GDT1 family protein [Nitrosomonas sp.]